MLQREEVKQLSSAGAKSKDAKAPTFKGWELAPLLVRNCTARAPTARRYWRLTNHRGAFLPGISSVPLWWGPLYPQHYSG